MKGKEIDRIVSRVLKVSIKDIRNKGGNRKISEARFVAMHLRNKYLKQSFNSLAKEWGYTTHTVSMTGIKNVRNHIETEKELSALVRLMERMVELRLEKICRNKKRYNDHCYLKQKGIEVKNEIVSLNVNMVESLSKSCIKKLNRMVEMQKGVQFAMNF